MRLSELEKNILGLIELDADKTNQQIAKELKIKTPTVQRTISNLIDKEIIAGKTAIIDIYRFGIIEYGIFIAWENLLLNDSELFIAELLKSKHVSWIAELGGEYDLTFNFMTNHPRILSDYLTKISTKFKGKFRVKDVVIRIRRQRYWRGYLSSKIRKNPQFDLGKELSAYYLDEIDQKILMRLSSLKFESYRELSLDLTIPVATILRRIQKLKENRIILGFGYRLNLEHMGVSQFRILISVADLSEDTHNQIKNFCSETGKVKVLCKTLGTFNFELEIDALSSEDAKMTARLVRNSIKFAGVNIQVIPIFKHRKFISFPTILNEN